MPTSLGEPCLVGLPAEKRDVKGLIRFLPVADLPIRADGCYWVLGFEEVGNHAPTRHGTVLFALSGEIRVVADDGRGRKERWFLTREGPGVYLPAGWWRTVDSMHRVGEASILGFFDGEYEPNEVIRDRKEFEKWAGTRAAGATPSTSAPSTRS